jgi:hypothetical protein
MVTFTPVDLESFLAGVSSKNAQIIESTGFKQENALQEYIHNNPESIPIYELREDKKLFIISREFSTNSGPIDAIGVDRDGDVYIIETKLYKNPDKRKVIAQALDYGASLWRHNIDFQKLLENFNKAVQEKFSISFAEKLKRFFELTAEEHEEALIENIKINFKEGNFKFIILMDQIGERLKDLIIFVNQNSKFDIYGVQFKHYNLDKYEIIIPKIFGVDIKKDITPPTKKIQWNKLLFIEALKKTGSADYIEVAENIFTWASANGLPIRWGAGGKQGTFYPDITIEGERYSLFGVYTTGKIEIVFQSLPYDEEIKRDLILELNKLEDVDIPEEAINSWKSFPMSSIIKEESFRHFIQCFDQVKNK